VNFTLEIGINLYHALRATVLVGASAWLIREWWVASSLRGKR